MKKFLITRQNKASINYILIKDGKGFISFVDFIREKKNYTVLYLLHQVKFE